MGGVVSIGNVRADHMGLCASVDHVFGMAPPSQQIKALQRHIFRMNFAQNSLLSTFTFFGFNFWPIKELSLKKGS